MSVVLVSAAPYAAGALWLTADRPRAITRAAKRSGLPFRAPYGTQVGLAGPGEEDHEGVPPLAASLATLIGKDAWVAFVAVDETGQACVVQAASGEIVSDAVYGTVEQAADAVRRLHDAGPALWASAGHLDDLHPQEIDPAALARVAAQEQVMHRSATGASLPRVVLTSTLAVAVLGGVGWFAWDSWLKPPPPPPPPPVMVSAAHDPLRLLAGCERARRAALLDIAGWIRTRVSCSAEMGRDDLPGTGALVMIQREIVRLHPDLDAAPVLLAEWELMPGLKGAVWRRIAERELRDSGVWKIFQVSQDRVWAARRLPSTLVPSDTTPDYVAFRAELEQAVALRGGDLEHGDAPAWPGGPAAATLTVPFDLATLYAIVRTIDGAEIRAIVSEPKSRSTIGWRVHMRKREPASITEDEYLARTSGP